MKKRSSGILMHITSLPSDYGIGTMGQSAMAFIDFLEKSGQSYWQILPLGPTGFGDSPYQSFSSFAGNPLLIDLEDLRDNQLLNQMDLESILPVEKEEEVDYIFVNNYKYNLLKKAYINYKSLLLEADPLMIEWQTLYIQFKETQSFWLDDYSLFMSLKSKFKEQPWKNWPHSLKERQEEAMVQVTIEHQDDIEMWSFIQFVFYKQWYKVKQYANEKGIKIVGDIPIYVAEDSADTWANPELFFFDEHRNATVVAGCPPDAFSEDGQLWGNPIYKWDMHKKTDFKWWIQRLRSCMTLYDVTRIDHFRGFDEYWEIPAQDDTARYGQWVTGPGIEFINSIHRYLPDMEIIAEDLGFLTPSVIDLLEKSTYPGMKVLQFAFDPREESDYLPHNYSHNCIVYTGTHDNDTINGWFNTIDDATKAFAIDYLKLTEDEGYHWGFIRGAWSSVGYLAIAQIQDVLAKGSESRMNIPSTIGINWKYRVKKDELTDDLATKIYHLTKIYGRLTKND